MIIPTKHASPGLQLVSYLDDFYKVLPRSIVIVETGCARSRDEGAKQGDGWSTVYFAEWCKENGQRHGMQRLVSIEQNPDNIAIARMMLGPLEVYVQFCCAESVFALERLNHVDFAYLDTSDDLEHGLAEFKAAEKCGASRIVMDDYNTKARYAAEYANHCGYKTWRDGRFTIIDLVHGS